MLRTAILATILAATVGELCEKKNPFVFFECVGKGTKFFKEEEAVLLFGGKELFGNASKDENIVPNRLDGRSFKTAYYSCPYFKDYPKLEYVTSMFYLKKVVENLRKIKVILVVKEEEMRKQFPGMMQQLAMVVDPEKDAGSIGLVVLGAEGKNIEQFLDEQKTHIPNLILAKTEQNDKKLLEDFIETKLAFSTVGELNLENLDLDVSQWELYFYEDLEQLVKKEVEEIRSHFSKWLDDPRSIFEDKFLESIKDATKTVKQLSIGTFETFVSEFPNLARNYVECRSCGEIRRKGEHGAFLLKDLLPPWEKTLHVLGKQLQGMADWGSYVLSFHDKLSTDYDTLSQIRALPDTNLTVPQLLTLMEPPQDNPPFDTSESFLPLPGSDSNLLKILRSVPNVTRTCTKQTLHIQGRYVFLSDVKDCPARRVEIFASSTVFIDTSYSRLGEMAQIFILAPVWVVLEETKISLQGIDAPDGNSTGKRSGGSGGVFYGVVMDYRNMEGLVVNVSGGNGEKGNDGVPGLDGKGSAKTIDFYPNYFCKEPEGVFDDFECVEKKDLNGTKRCELVQKGGEGSDGGMPSSGGLGGHPGIATIIFLSTPSNPTLITTPGLNGSTGDCGPGGEGAPATKYLLDITCHKKGYFSYQTYDVKNERTIKKPDGACNTNIKPAIIVNKPEKPTLGDVGEILGRYRRFLLAGIEGEMDLKSFSKFYNLLPGGGKVGHFVEELKDIENLPGKKTQYLGLYESFLTRIEESSMNNLSNEEKILSNFIFTSALAQYNKIKHPTARSLLVGSIDQYSELVLWNIEKLNETDGFALKNYDTDYKDYIHRMAKDLNKEFAEKVIPVVSAAITHIDTKIPQVLENATVLKELVAKKKLLVVLQVLALALKILGSTSGAIGTVIGAGTFVPYSMIPEGVTLPQPRGMARYLELAYELFEKIDEDVRGFVENKKVGFEGILSEVVDLVSSQKDLEDLKEFVEKRWDKLEEMRSFEDLMEFEEELMAIFGVGRRYKMKQDTAMKVEVLVKFIKTDIQLYRKYKNESATLELLKESIKSNSPLLTFITFENHITSFLKNTLQLITSNLTQFMSTTEFYQEIQAKFRQFQKDLKASTTNLNLTTDLTIILHQFDEAIRRISHLYNCLEDFSDQKRLSDHVKVLTHDKLQTNTRLKKLKLGIKTNVILGQYKRLTDIVKQHVFPFARAYEYELSLPDKPSRRMIKSVMQRIQTAAVELTENFPKGLIKTNANTTRYLHTMNEPFYVWTNKKYGKTIAKLFDGDEIILRADVMDNNVKNAVKFNVIDLKFRTGESLQPLEYYNIQLTHFGNSYYRCEDSSYIFSTDKWVFVFSHERDRSGPVNMNQIYSKISKRPHVLSPYALWGVKLIDEHQVGYGVLQGLKYRVDLELTGSGEYVSGDEGVCGSDLKHYYTEV